MSAEKIAEVEIAAPRAVVWQALREPAQIRNWFGWEAPGLADEIEMIFGGVTADEAAGTLDFGEWQGVADRFELSERAGKTVLVVVRTGPAPEGGWAAAYDEVIEGWISFSQQLRLYLEQHRQDTRRTLWFSAKAGPGAIEALGLIGAGEVSSRYSRELSPGDTVSGEVWHWARHQVGVLVEQWSGGLIIAGDRVGGGGTALLTVYGLSDAEFSALETRWNTWWSAAYPEA